MSALNKFFVLVLIVLGFENSLFAQSLVLKNAREAPTPIAIQGFLKGEGADSKTTSDVEAMLTSDLIFSRIFKVIPAEAFLESKIPGAIQNFQVDPWRQTGASYV